MVAQADRPPPPALLLSGRAVEAVQHPLERRTERGDAAYFTNPTHYVPHLHGAHLDWLRSRLHVVLTVGEGAWETHPTGSLPSARQMAHLLDEKAISHELDVWGHDVSHDWPWWRKQIAHHLPRFC